MKASINTARRCGFSYSTSPLSSIWPLKSTSTRPSCASPGRPLPFLVLFCFHNITIRAVKDLETLRKEAEDVQAQIASFEGKVAVLDKETKGPVKIIAKLDLVKERMKQVTRVLEGAKKFDALSGDMEHAIQAQDPDRVRSCCLIITYLASNCSLDCFYAL